METVTYYLHNFWQDYGDAKVSNDFPLMYGGPWKVLALLGLYAFLALKAGPKWMKERKAFDLRPIMLIYNGFLFGINGAGFLIALWVTNFGTNSWSCINDDSRWSGLAGTTMKYLGYIYMATKIFDFCHTACDILRKKQGSNILGQVLHNSYLVMFAYMGLKFYPRGIFCFLPLMDTFTQSVRLAYYVLASAGSSLRFSLWWKKYVTRVQICEQLLLVAHSLYVTFVPNCAGPQFLKAIVLLYGVLSLAFYVPFYRRNYSSSRKLDKN